MRSLGVVLFEAWEGETSPDPGLHICLTHQPLHRRWIFLVASLSGGHLLWEAFQLKGPLSDLSCCLFTCGKQQD